eukprot:GHVL01022461.1.p1 GENE.GHVL01022461.1~~GHVL01022461.1.p1  ORF type:complete len:1707 (+),score=517.52 GHVL01022461.1:3823-8943(+)
MDPTIPKACPSGHYCPEGSAWPVPCPPGTYSKDDGGESVDSCLSCPEGMYQDTLGASICVSCGETSESQPKSTTCHCLGKHRVFQKSDSSCRCEKQFEYLNENFESVDMDSTFSCQPIIVERCSSSTRRWEDSSCREPDNCERSCGSEKKGIFLSSVGICQCEDIDIPDLICDFKCREEQSKITLTDNAIILEETLTGTKYNATFVSLKSDGVIDGLQSCVKLNRDTGNIECSVTYLQTNKNRAGGLFGPSKNLEDIIKKSAIKTSVRLLSEDISQRQLQTEDISQRQLQTSNTQPIVSNAVTCSALGGSVIWHIIDGVYPVYDQHSLLNSNANFDFKKFTKLGNDIKSGSSIEFFSYTFNSDGTYVFVTSESDTDISVVRVLPSGVACQNLYEYPQPMTAINLSSLGIKMTEVLVLEPDWLLIAIVIAVLAIVVIMLFLCMRIARGGVWDNRSNRRHKAISDVEYRQNLMKANWTLGDTKGDALAITRDAVEESTEMVPIDKVVGEEYGVTTVDDENLQIVAVEGNKNTSELQDALQNYSLEMVDTRVFQACYEKLRDHSVYCSKKFDEHDKNTSNEAEIILKEAQILKEKLLAVIKKALTSHEHAEMTFEQKRRLIDYQMQQIDPSSIPDSINLNKIIKKELFGDNDSDTSADSRDDLSDKDSGYSASNLSVSDLDLHDQQYLEEAIKQIEQDVIIQMNELKEKISNSDDPNEIEKMQEELVNVASNMKKQKEDIILNVKEKSYEKKEFEQESIKRMNNLNDDLNDSKEDLQKESYNMISKIISEQKNIDQENADDIFAIHLDHQKDSDRQRNDLKDIYMKKLEKLGDSSSDKKERELLLNQYKIDSDRIEEEINQQWLNQKNEIQKKLEERKSKKALSKDADKIIDIQQQVILDKLEATADEAAMTLDKNHEMDIKSLEKSLDLELKKDINDAMIDCKTDDEKEEARKRVLDMNKIRRDEKISALIERHDKEDEIRELKNEIDKININYDNKIRKNRLKNEEKFADRSTNCHTELRQQLHDDLKPLEATLASDLNIISIKKSLPNADNIALQIEEEKCLEKFREMKDIIMEEFDNNLSRADDEIYNDKDNEMNNIIKKINIDRDDEIIPRIDEINRIQNEIENENIQHIEDKQEIAIDALNIEMDKEKEEALKIFEDEQKTSHKKLIDEEKKKLKNQLKNLGDDDEDERIRLIDEHEYNIRKLDEMMSQDSEIQKTDLLKRCEERRREKQEALKAKNEAEMKIFETQKQQKDAKKQLEERLKEETEKFMHLAEEDLLEQTKKAAQEQSKASRDSQKALIASCLEANSDAEREALMVKWRQNCALIDDHYAEERQREDTKLKERVALRKKRLADKQAQERIIQESMQVDERKAVAHEIEQIVLEDNQLNDDIAQVLYEASERERIIEEDKEEIYRKRMAERKEELERETEEKLKQQQRALLKEREDKRKKMCDALGELDAQKNEILSQYECNVTSLHHALDMEHERQLLRFKEKLHAKERRQAEKLFGHSVSRKNLDLFGPGSLALLRSKKVMMNLLQKSKDRKEGLPVKSKTAVMKMDSDSSSSSIQPRGGANSQQQVMINRQKNKQLLKARLARLRPALREVFKELYDNKTLHTDHGDEIMKTSVNAQWTKTDLTTPRDLADLLNTLTDLTQLISSLKSNVGRRTSDVSTNAPVSRISSIEPSISRLRFANKSNVPSNTKKM